MTEIIRVSPFLRYVLLADAATCAACGLLLALGGAFLQNLSGLPAPLMFYAGLSLFPFTAFLVFAATRKSVSKPAVWAIVGLNLLWTIDSFLLLASGYVEPTAFGYAFVIFQAIGVLAFAELEFIGLRKAEVVVFKDAKETI
ncbi:MAG TPA: hypothetical protein VIL74_05845 [Pyrinomonadaceae bacterium]|jgi:hypothetical protein